MKILFEANSVCVLIDRPGEDEISFNVDAPTAHPEMKYAVYLKMRARKGFGIEWVKQNLPGTHVDVISMKHGLVESFSVPEVDDGIAG